MSRDIILIKTPTNDEPFAEITSTIPFSRREVITALQKDHPEVNCHDETRIRLERPDCSVLFSLGSDPIRTISLTIDGETEPIDVITTMCRALNCRAMRTATGEFIDIPQDSGYSRRLQFHDRVVKATTPARST